MLLPFLCFLLHLLLLKSPYIAENPSLVEKIMDNMMLHHSSAGDRFKVKIDGIRELF